MLATMRLQNYQHIRLSAAISVIGKLVQLVEGCALYQWSGFEPRLNSFSLCWLYAPLAMKNILIIEICNISEEIHNYCTKVLPTEPIGRYPVWHSSLLCSWLECECSFAIQHIRVRRDWVSAEFLRRCLCAIPMTQVRVPGWTVFHSVG